MVKATFDALAERDKQLVLETEPKKLKRLDEDELIDLHTRVRRARNKHAKLYRRQAGAQVAADRARAMASKENRRISARAEVLEDALARVSRRLGTVARAASDELRAERLAIAASSKGGRTKKASSAGAAKDPAPAGSGSAKRSLRTPASEQARGRTSAKGRRRQAARDGR